MRLALEHVLLVALATCFVHGLCAQASRRVLDLITPLHSNAVTLSSSFYDGSINFYGALPVADATGDVTGAPILNDYHAFGFFGRSANVVASLPYGVGNFQGTVDGAGNNLYR